MMIITMSQTYGEHRDLKHVALGAAAAMLEPKNATKGPSAVAVLYKAGFALLLQSVWQGTHTQALVLVGQAK